MTRFKFRSAFSLAAAFALTALHAQAVTIDTVPVGHPGNRADTRIMFPDDTTGYGSVAYAFRMGTTEVTNAQYVESLNAVAASDPYRLWNSEMQSAHGGIIRSGLPGNFSYSVNPPAVGQGPGSTDYTYENKPVNLVTWYNAIRFANWLHNGQGGPGTTEDGAYTIRPGILPIFWVAGPRNPGARWFLPSEDEWYKSAYYDPDSESYYEYPTGTNSVPNNNLPDSDTGNSGNFPQLPDGYTTGNPSYPLTDAGAYALSDSRYGTFDQGGNLWEWNEARTEGAIRGVRGGSWLYGGDFTLRPSYRSGYNPSSPSVHIGFHVATIIPEPSTIVLLGLGVLLLERRLRR